MGTKHRQDVFDAIRDALLEAEGYRRGYSALYKGVNEKLQLLRKNPKFVLSPRDFSSELNILVNEHRLYREQDNKSKKKIKPVNFSLTEGAIKEHRFNILGIDLEKERRRKLYQLLFFFQAFSPPKQISIQKFHEILVRIPLPRNRLKLQDIADYSSDEGILIETYEPVEHIMFSVINDLRGEYVSCKLLSFSKREIIEYSEKLRANKLKYPINISFLEDSSLTKEKLDEELEKAFTTLRDTDLIKPIRNVFYDEDDTRFIFADEKLSGLINEIWQVLLHQWTVLQQNWNYLKEPTDDEKEWLRYFYGDNETKNIINNARNKRKSFFLKYRQNLYAHIRSVLEETMISESYLNEMINQLYSRYSKVVQEYAFPPNLIEDIIRRIFSPVRES